MNEAALKQLNTKQQDVCRSRDNLLVTACPGSGKTRTLTHKIAYLIDNETSIKKIVAITYTNRAADEILNRLNQMGIDCSRLWVGTIHQFCLDFILSRFKMYNLSISKSFSIIDEKISKQYVNEIANSLNISISSEHYPNLKFDRNLEYIEKDVSFLKIVKKYYDKLQECKEIDFDMILVHSFKILRKNPTISSIIKNSIELLCVDEYQDTQDLQFAIIEAIYNSNLGINMQINFFGDPNQAIFTSLGGCAKTIIELNSEFLDSSFKEYIMDGCYRSNQEIINFYSGFMIEQYNIQSLVQNHGNVYYFNGTIDKNNLTLSVAEIVKTYLNKGIDPKDICVVAPTWFFLFPFARDLKKQLPNIPFDAPDITPIKKDPLNFFYKITYILLTRPSTYRFLYRLKMAREILDRASFFSNISIEPVELLNFANSLNDSGENDLIILKSKIKKIIAFLGINLNSTTVIKSEFDNFFDKIQDRLTTYRDLTCNVGDFEKMFDEKNGIVINTIHGIKGEEYRVVICFGLLNSKIPSSYTDVSMRDSEAKKMLYVLSSRAKNDLILIAETGRKYKKNNDYYDDAPTPYLVRNIRKHCKIINSIKEIAF